MSDCKKYKDMFVNTLYGELSSEEKRVLANHLKDCASCRDEFEELKTTLEMMSRRVRPEPGKEFFDGYWDRLAERMDREREAPTAQDKWWESLSSRIKGFSPRWAYQAVVSVLLVVVGIYLGRTVFTSGQGTNQSYTAAQGVSQPVSQIDALQRAFDYIQRSELVVLAISNFDAEKQDPYALDLPYQQQISKELVQEAGWLREELSGRHHRRLQELISDLEATLLQIANLDSGSDISAIELVQDGLKSRGILFKIHLAGTLQLKDLSRTPTETDRALNKPKRF